MVGGNDAENGKNVQDLTKMISENQQIWEIEIFLACAISTEYNE